MRTTITRILAFAIAFGGASYASAADVCATASNFVKNCGFETSDLTGWTVSGTDSAPANYGIYYGVENYSQYSGNYAGYFGGVGGDITLSQMLSNLIPSFVYTVTVEAFNDTPLSTGYLNDLSITLGNRTSLPITQATSGNYVSYSFLVSANSASQTVAINSRNDAGFWNIDSVQVVFTSTPEPSVLTLCVVSLALLSGWAAVGRRRRALAV